jgi:hypothetical protein
VAHLSPTPAGLTFNADGSFSFQTRRSDGGSTFAFDYYITNPDGTSGIGTVTITVDEPDIIERGPGGHQRY